MLLLWVLIYCSFSVTYAQNQIKNNDLKTLIIDVRTKYEYGRGHLKNAINIPHTQIKHKIKEHTKDKDSKIIVYCQSGYRSRTAKKILGKNGYKDVINAGAYAKLKNKY